MNSSFLRFGQWLVQIGMILALAACGPTSSSDESVESLTGAATVDAGAPAPASAVSARVATIINDTLSDGGSDGGDSGVFLNNGRVTYQGGVVITDVKVAAVLWGAVAPEVVSDIGGFYQTATSGSLMHFVSEYKTPTQTPGAYGTVLGTYTIQPNNTALVLTDADIVAELGAQIAAGVLPPNDANTVYMVHLAPGIGVNDPTVGGQSCVPSGFCGYHKSGNGIVYSVIPDTSQGGCAPGPPGCKSCCGDSSPFDTTTSIASHELIESITDPFPTQSPAWDNPLAGEVADLCVYALYGHAAYTTIYARNGRSYMAQKAWSNAAFAAHMGYPVVGCVDYPTTLCCSSAQSDCSWLPSGSLNCPNPIGNSTSASTFPNGLVLTAPTLGGFGNATAALSQSTVGREYPLGITDLLSGGSVMSPTIQITTDTALVGATTACFAHVTDANEKGIVQCVPEVPGVTCAQLKGTTQRTSSGVQCCIPLASQISTDGTQICARLPVFGSNVLDLPAFPRWASVAASLLIIAAGAFAARSGRFRGTLAVRQS